MGSNRVAENRKNIMNTRPNIIFILADDMGYGDIRRQNPESAFPTPNLDALIDDGLRFSDAHTSSSVCTPSRYSILTGRYCWRTYLKSGVLSAVGDALIPENRPTFATLAKQAGYDTACIGKWHVGWEWAVKKEYQGQENRHAWTGDEIDWIDYGKPIKNGPTTVGFDYFHGISGSLDMPPYVYVENDMPVEEPTAWGSGNEFLREGPRMRSLRANNVLSHLTEKAVEYIENRGDNPYMLYFPITAPHTPISPAPEFDGVSGVNPYADFCMEVDHRVGQIVEAVRERGDLDNTLIVFTTDNGASAIPSECAMLEKRYGHHCSHIYRGYKSDIWDGGHRVPFIMRWGETIKSGSVCDQQVGVFDFYATVADILGVEVENDSGEDSISLLPSFSGNPVDTDRRQALIHHSINGMFAIRSGKWKLCCCPGSGGWSSPRDDETNEANDLQLYDMTSDPSEKRNLVDEYPRIVEDLEKILSQCIVNGSSIVGKKGVEVQVGEMEKWEQIKRLPELPENYVVDD